MFSVSDPLAAAEVRGGILGSGAESVSGDYLRLGLDSCAAAYDSWIVSRLKSA